VSVRKATIAQVRAGRGGRLVQVDDDIFDMAKRLHEIDTSLGLDWNDTAGYFRVTQTLPDGRKHVVTTARELTPDLIELVRRLASSDYDYVGELERIDAEGKRDREHRMHEQTGEMGELLHHAIRQDLGYKPRIFLPRGVEGA
jgi:hypothetical protein